MKKSIYIAAFLLLSLVISCNLKNGNRIKDLDKRYNEKIAVTFGKEIKTILYNSASDTIINWVDNNLLIDSAFTNSGKPFVCKYKLDSTICINSFGDKLIGTMHQFIISEDNEVDDGISEFLGAKIDGKWYFWRGGYMPVMRASYKNHDPSKPLSYAQLHEQAMKSFLGGYLTKNGEINEAWFESKFKDGYYSFKDRYKYKHILDGKRIDNETDYWEYIWRKKGQMLWYRKAYQDSVARVNEK